MRKLIALVLAGVAATALDASQVALPSDSSRPVRFAVIGDAGTGRRPQHEVGERLAAARSSFPFEFVVMTGDNMYGRQSPQDFVDKFERPYAALLEAGVRFYAALGNHDRPSNRFYEGFNMRGERFYTFVMGPVRFVMLDTNAMDRSQLTWLERVLGDAREPWKIAVFHHPLYSNARRHGPSVDLRVLLEPVFTRHAVNVVFAGHEHVYERLKPQKGITHFIEGASGQLRKGDMRPSDSTAAAYDDDRTFMLVEVRNDQMTFRTLSRTGLVVDSGVIARRGEANRPGLGTTPPAATSEAPRPRSRGASIPSHARPLAE